MRDGLAAAFLEFWNLLSRVQNLLRRALGPSEPSGLQCLCIMRTLRVVFRSCSTYYIDSKVPRLSIQLSIKDHRLINLQKYTRTPRKDPKSYTSNSRQKPSCGALRGRLCCTSSIHHKQGSVVPLLTPVLDNVDFFNATT